MTLRNRTVSLIIFFLAILMSGLYGISEVFLTQGFDKVEKRWANENLERLEEAFDVIVENIRAKSADWAIWSDTYNYVEDLNPAYKETNLNDVSFGNLQINHMFLLNARQEFAYQHSYDYENNKPLNTPQTLVDLFNPSSKLLKQNIEDTAAGVWMANGIPIIFVARPILTSERKGPIHGTLVFARDFNQSQVNHLAEVTKMQLELLAIDQLGKAVSHVDQLSDTIAIQNKSDDFIEGFVLIKDYLGNDAFYFKVTMERVIAKQARATKRSVAISLIIMSIIFILLFVAFINRLFFRRIFEMTDAIAQIGKQQDDKRRLKIIGNDEIDSMGRTINNMLDEKQDSLKTIKEREEMLRKKDWQLLEAQSKRVQELEEVNKKVNERTKELEMMQQANLNIMEDFQQARQEAEAASKAKSQFLANMSHEIRTPLNAILGFSDLLKKTSLNTDQRHHLDIVTSSGQLLLSVINDILDISKIEAGKIELESINFNLIHSIEGVMKITQDKVLGKPVIMRHEIEEGIPLYVIGDPTRLAQILVNLLSNAAKFTEKGEIVLQVKRRRDIDSDNKLGLWFGIKDTGIGIPADKIDLLFKPFNQADTSTTRKFGGTGLGLAICKSLVEMMGGKIWIESEYGRGSVFQFTVLFLEGKKEVQSNQPANEQVISIVGCRILVVEDSKPNQDLLKAYFGIMKVNAQFCHNGQEAVNHYKTNRAYDLILMDMQMPVMGGIEATTIIRREIDQHIPIIALTAAALREDQENCLKAGMNDFLTKPIDINKLKATIARFIKTEAVAGGIDTAVKETINNKIVEPVAGSISVAQIADELGLNEDEFKEILEGVFEMADKDMPILLEAIKAVNYPDIKSLAHRLKGTMANMRLNPVAEVMKKIEQGALDKLNANDLVLLFEQANQSLLQLRRQINR